MSSFHGRVDTMGLSFFGSMTASISHELKNALAVINENAGLMGDLAALAEKGRPLAPERVRAIVDTIQRRVQGADGIIRRLNSFAHSANHPVRGMGIREILEASIALSARLAAMKEATLTLAPGEEIQVHTLAFVVQNLLWICLKQTFALAEGGLAVEFAARSAAGEVEISLAFTPAIAVEQLVATVSAEAQPLILFLRMQVAADTEASRLLLRMPKQYIE